MSLSDLNAHHLRLIGLYATRYSIRGGAGLLFFLLVLAVGLIVAYIVMFPLEQIEYDVRVKHESPAGIQRIFHERTEQTVPVVSMMLGERGWRDTDIADSSKDRWASWLLFDNPTLLSQVLLILVFALPFLSVIGGFNQYAGDVGTRGIRFHLLRTERANLYFGRFLGAAAYSSITLVVLLLTVVAYLGLRVDFYSWWELLTWGARGLIALFFILLPYLALAGLFSALVDSPFGALVLSALPVAGVPIVALLAGSKWSWAANVKWLLPWGCQQDLLHPDVTRFLGAALACLGYAAVFLALGYRHFSKRDL